MDDEQREGQPGPIYDDAMKILADDDIDALLSVLGIGGGTVTRLNVELTAPKMTADLLARTPTGLVHVEFVKDPKSNLGQRMLRYWTRVRERYPDDPITQYQLVLGDRKKVPDRYVDGGVSCAWTVVRVEDLDPAVLLATPTTAAIAAMGRGTTTQRAAALAAALEQIRSSTTPDRGQALLGAAVTLASIVLPRGIIRSVLEEAAMPVLVRDTPLGREIYDEGRDKGRQEGLQTGLQTGRQEGRQEGRQALLRALLRQRYGDDPRIDGVVERLARLSDDDGLARLTAATALDDLDH